ncbi:MAG: DNA mismatch repair endonuclease MutL [Saprospiraceae bacterium]|nr:DNA mismatch repair endonuclease MutL [Saprospiraceae bacterium]
MPDIIQLLPDGIANQIAAGEVIQRPASVIKELMENAIDAGASAIKIIIKDAGKTSVQVVDDGKGMSQTDARMSFERHATSKIRSANDLFCIKTMGFRGEALASIAAISHVEMITRQINEDIGNRILIEGTVIMKQDMVQAMPGTSITIKNLFYNVPARRKFLKSDPVELKHILDEFHRVVLANPDVHFTLHHNGNELYHLPKSNLKQRIIGVLGKQINDKLIPVNEDTEVATFSGFIGKAETSRKTQGDQYIFVNKRFIRSNYLNHAVRAAYEDLITKDVFPTYFLFLEIDPANIDINVHPTKTEIKFEDERLIYNYLRVSLKHSLGQYSLSPMLDFNTDHNFAYKFSGDPNIVSSDLVSKKVTSSYPLENEATFRPGQESSKGWEQIYQGLQEIKIPDTDHDVVNTVESEAFQLTIDESETRSLFSTREPYQLHNTYIIHQLKTGMMIIDQQAAHERVLYEFYLGALQNGELFSQKELFPHTIELDQAQAIVLKKILSSVNALGFEMEEFGQNTFIVHGTPSGLDSSVSIEVIVQKLISQYLQNLEFELGIEDNLARSMAYSASIKRGKRLEKEEMTRLIDQLFGCGMPYKSPSGKKCYVSLELDELAKRFNH